MGSTVSGLLGFLVFYWGKTVLGWFIGWAAFSTGLKPGFERWKKHRQELPRFNRLKRLEKCSIEKRQPYKPKSVTVEIFFTKAQSRAMGRHVIKTQPSFHDVEVASERKTYVEYVNILTRAS